MPLAHKEVDNRMPPSQIDPAMSPEDVFQAWGPVRKRTHWGDWQMEKELNFGCAFY
jgi:hypothetical protein